MRRRWRTVVTVGFVAALFVPAVRPGDGVPLSSYQMYATPRSPEISFVVPVGVQVGGDPVHLSSRTIAATADPLIAEAYLRREVNEGRVEELCAAIASRVTEAHITAIEIRLETHHVVERVLGDRAPINSKKMASCPAD